MLGVCLGAQLIALALGARVFPGPLKEIGFAPIAFTTAETAAPMGDIDPEQPALHWHGDTFNRPKGASCLASTHT